MDEYTRIEKIGEGTYGVVYKAKKTNGDIVALKKIPLELEDQGVPTTAIREISTLRELQHENVVKLFDIVCEEKRLFLVFEYLDEDLRHHLDSIHPNCLSFDLATSYLRQLLEALAYCHARKIVHRDLKPQNLLLDKTGVMKLADFGLARCMAVPARPYTHEVVTVWYRPPELLLGLKAYTPAVDLWSLGCIFAEMITSRPLFPGDSEIDQLYRIFRTLGTISEETWKDVTSLSQFNPNFPKWPKLPLREAINSEISDATVDILQGLFRYDPAKRLTAREALAHPLFKEAQEQAAESQ